MLLNSWKMSVVAGREQALHDFCEREFLAVLQNQPACLGAYFSQTAHDLITFTLWQDQSGLTAFEQDPAFLHLQQRLLRLEYIASASVAEVWPVQVGFQNAALGLRLAQLSQPSLMMDELT